MTSSAKSVYFFGCYLLLLGIILLVQPNWLLIPVGIPVTDEVWIRVVGMLVLALSAYYLTAGKLDFTPILKMTVYVRGSIILFFTTFVLMHWVQPAIILFGVIDLLGAIHTYIALRKEGRV